MVKVKVLPILSNHRASAHLLFPSSLEPTGPVKVVTLDEWLVHRSACNNLRKDSTSVTHCILIAPYFTDPEGMKSCVEVNVCSRE